MSPSYSTEFIDQAHKATIFHEQEILANHHCTCFYCGYQFDPQTEPDLQWWDETNPKGRTLV